MKQGIHPTIHPVVFVDVATKDEIVTTSTLTSDETKDIDGVSHYVIYCDVTSFSHPFFTGEQRFVDRQKRIDKFIKKRDRAEKRTSRKAVVTDSEERKSYQEILKEHKTNSTAAA